MKISIVCVAYNRLAALKRLLSSLLSATYEGKVDLVVSIDKSDSDSVAKYADTFVWPYGEKIVAVQSANLGLKRHILSLGKYLDNYDALIVLEDDIIVAPSFYMFAKDAVRKYSDNSFVAGISLYSYAVNYQNGLPFMPVNNGWDVYFMKIAMSWGQVWMKESWKDFYRWYEENSDFIDSPNIPGCLVGWGEKSWLKYQMRYCIEENKYFIYPYVSFSNNVSEPGEHSAVCDSLFSVNMFQGIKISFNLPEYDVAMKYDGFYETEDIPPIGDGIDSNEVCMNVYNEKRSLDGRRYMVSCFEYDAPVVKSFRLLFRPVEKNICPGNENGSLYVYDMQNVPYERKNCYISLDVYKYFYNLSSFLFRQIALPKNYQSLSLRGIYGRIKRSILLICKKINK